MAAPLRALVLCVVLAGCGGHAKKSSHHTSSSSQSSRSSTAAATPPKPIATVDYAADDSSGPVRFQVSIYDLRRDGPFLVLDFGLACLTPSTGCSTDITFVPPNETTSTEVETNNQVPSGVSLIDPAGLKQYLPVRDSQGYPFTSQLADIHDSLIHLEWIRYPAAPATARSLDVVFPDGGPQIPNVPITASTGPVAAGNVQAAQPAQFAQPPTSANTTGLTLPVQSLSETVGNLTGSDTESANRATVTLRSDVLFRFAKSSLTPAARTVLAGVAGQIKRRARGTVQVTGYTDSIGSDAVNLPLSRARAHSVEGVLARLTPGVSYSSTGRGSADPVAPNTNPDGSDDPAGRALNRRVTISFAVKTPAKPQAPATSTASQTSSSGPAASTATFTVTTTGDTYQTSVDGVFREGSLLVVRLGVVCVHVQSGNSCNSQSDLAGLPTVPPLPMYTESANATDPASFFTASGFYLLDPRRGTEYLTLRAADGTPVTGDLYGSPGLNDSFQMWLYFPAPPPSVSTITLLTPGGKARLRDLSIASTAPPQP